MYGRLPAFWYCLTNFIFQTEEMLFTTRKIKRRKRKTLNNKKRVGLKSYITFFSDSFIYCQLTYHIWWVKDFDGFHSLTFFTVRIVKCSVEGGQTLKSVHSTIIYRFIIMIWQKQGCLSYLAVVTLSQT